MEGGSGLKKRNRIIITVISIVAVTILISFVKPANLSMRLTSCWNTILLAAIISVMIFCPIVSKERDIFSPFVMASVLLFALFIYAPLTCIPVLLALGATRDDKGLDILLDALNFVNHDFQLLIAGKEESFSEEFIDEHTKKYSTKVTKLLKFLDDYKFAECLSAADFVVLPYRKCFDGASGPLGEGVVLGKTIIGPNHGSLGDIIEKNHLGYIFEAENINSLAKVLDKALTRTMQHDKEYLAYQRMLDPEIFAEKYVELFMKVQKHNKI